MTRRSIGRPEVVRQHEWDLARGEDTSLALEGEDPCVAGAGRERLNGRRPCGSSFRQWISGWPARRS